MSEHVRFAEGLHARQDKLAPEQVNLGAEIRKPEDLRKAAPREHGVTDEQFPTEKYSAKSPDDREIMARLALQDPAHPGYTQFGKLEAREKDFKWAQQKAAAAELADFELWFAKEFDKMDPVQKERAKELNPAFYQSRLRLLREQADNVFRLAKLKLEGPQDFDDILTTYLAETGRLDLGPLKDLMNPERSAGTKKQNEVAFQRGLANPFLVFGKQVYPNTDVQREKDALQFASRRETKGFEENLSLGLEKHNGFPPFKDAEANSYQSDASWYSVLAKGVGRN